MVPIKLANPYLFTSPLRSVDLNVASGSAKRNPRLSITGNEPQFYRTCIWLLRSHIHWHSGLDQVSHSSVRTLRLEIDQPPSDIGSCICQKKIRCWVPNLGQKWIVDLPPQDMLFNRSDLGNWVCLGDFMALRTHLCHDDLLPRGTSTVNIFLCRARRLRKVTEKKMDALRIKKSTK